MIHSKLFTSGIHVLYLYKILFLGMVIDFICSEAFKQQYVPSIFVKIFSLIVFLFNFDFYPQLCIINGWSIYFMFLYRIYVLNVRVKVCVHNFRL